MPEAEATIRGVIDAILKRRDADGLEVRPDSRLTDDLGLDSLELAELSASLEDDLGSDPYTEGIVPATVGELVGFYRG
jgi:acyl carrier protein